MGTLSAESSVSVRDVFHFVLLAVITDELEVALHGQIFTLLVSLLDVGRTIVGFVTVE